MVAELVETALKMPKYRDILQEAEETGATIPAKEDPRGKTYQTQTRVEDDTFSPAQLKQLEALLGGNVKAQIVSRKATKPDSELTDRMNEMKEKIIESSNTKAKKTTAK